MAKTLTARPSVAEAARGPHRLRAVDYLRVSTEEQKKGYGITAAGKKTVRHITKKDWEHVGTYADEGISGSLEAAHRPELKRLMRDAHSTPRPFDIVIVSEGRAIGRTGRAFWRWVWDLQDLGVYVAVVKDDYDNSTPEGCKKMRKDADYAEEEREVIRERTQGGLQEKAEEGGFTGGRAPYGWMIQNKGVKGKSRLVRDPHEYDVLRRAWELLVLHSKNARAAAIQLNAEGMVSRSGRPWSNRNLLNKLKSEAVTNACVTFRKHGRAKVGHDGTPLYGESVAIPLEPAFTPDELTRLKAALGRDSCKRDLQGAPEYPLTKRVIGRCGRHYTGFHRPGIRGYRCSGKQEKYAGSGYCTCSQVDADLLEEAVWGQICTLLGDADKLRRLSEEWVGMAAGSKASHVERIAELDGQIEDQINAIDLTMTVAAKQAATRKLGRTAAEAAIQRAIQPLQEELVALGEMRAEAAAWQAETEQAAQRARDLQELATLARTRLHDLSPAGQAEVLALLDVKVAITSAPPRRERGAPAPLPALAITGGVEPRLFEHLGERSRGGSCTQVSSRVIRFRMDLAA